MLFLLSLLILLFQEMRHSHCAEGLSGIAFARFYLEIHPEARIVVLEADCCTGGACSACE